MNSVQWRQADRRWLYPGPVNRIILGSESLLIVNRRLTISRAALNEFKQVHSLTKLNACHVVTKKNVGSYA